MYALVFWINSKQISIVRDSQLHPTKEESEITNIEYNGKYYKGKIVRKSYDKNYLECIKVTSDGEILTKNKNTHKNLAEVKKQEILKKKSKMDSKKKQEVKNKKDRQLIFSPSIFEDSEEDEENENAIRSQKVHEKNQDSLSESSDQENRQRQREVREESGNSDVENQREMQWEREEEIMQELEVEKHQRRQRKIQCRSTEESQRERERDIQREKTIDREAGTSKESDSRSRSKYIERNNRQSDVEEDPLDLSRQGGNGRVMICDVWNVWIDKAKLTYFQRWRKEPKEMTRRLLKTLIGTENLKSMCARGRSSTRRPIPEDIMNAVEYYVNETCVKHLRPSEFSAVTNMMICSLRNPRR